MSSKKTSSESQLVISEVMMPSQANVAGNIHGGEIMKLMDSTAYAAARRYARSNVVTARVDELEFHLPIFIGDLVICTAQVVFAGKSSMEVAVTWKWRTWSARAARRRSPLTLQWFPWTRRLGLIWCRS